MKQILDVSEKYEAIDLMDKRKVIDEEKDDLNLSTSVKDNEDQTHSVQPITNYKYFSCGSPSFSRIHSPENSSISIVNGRKGHFGKTSSRPIKFLSDYIFVLAKTYTNSK